MTSHSSEHLYAQYDPESHALYVRLRDLPIARTEIRDVGHHMDIAADGHIVGYEFLLDEPLDMGEDE